MGEIKSYKDLLIWQRGIDLTQEIYTLTNLFPNTEQFGLISQMRRCSISVPSNIAEGFGRESNASFAQFIKISRGTLYELETQILIAKRIGLIENQITFDKLISLISELAKMISGFLKSIK
jgi:four helix bundle protein